jgi:hypothetical protein
MGCADGFEYYVKLVGRCQEQARFREAEYMTARLGQLLGAPVLEVAAVFVPGPIATMTGLPVAEQWAVGTKKSEIVPETQGTFASTASAQSPEDLLRIAALHIWLAVSDHDNTGHNFFRRIPDGRLMTADHCSALAAAFAAGAPLPVAPSDPAGLLTIRAYDPAVRSAVAADLGAVSRPAVEAVVSEFPDDPQFPWLPVNERPSLVDWITARQPGVVGAIAP